MWAIVSAPEGNEESSGVTSFGQNQSQFRIMASLELNSSVTFSNFPWHEPEFPSGLIFATYWSCSPNFSLPLLVVVIENLKFHNLLFNIPYNSGPWFSLPYYPLVSYTNQDLKVINTLSQFFLRCWLCFMMCPLSSIPCVCMWTFFLTATECCFFQLHPFRLRALNCGMIHTWGRIILF